MKFILILWFTGYNVKYSNSVYNDGSIIAVEFNNKVTCEVALTKIVEKAVYVNGVCVEK